MKTIVCLIRHGQTAVNNSKRIQGREDHLLNDTGRNQALRTGKYLKDNDPNWDFIYSSPLSRAYETANIIKSQINYQGDVIKDDSFIERDFGAAEGMPITKEIFEYIIRDDVKDLEKSYEIQKRVSDGVLRLCNKHKGKKILIVAHSHAIKGLLTHLDKNRTFLDPLLNCSMSYFVEENGVISIDRVNINPEE